MSTPVPAQSLTPRTKIGAARIALSLIVVLGSLGLLLFVPAVRLDWVEAWALIAAYGVFLALYAWWGLRRDPEQLRERGQARKAENVKPWDKAIMAVYTVFLLLTPRRRRPGRGPVPLVGRAAAGEEFCDVSARFGR
jgi:hypothetical protein